MLDPYKILINLIERIKALLEISRGSISLKKNRDKNRCLLTHYKARIETYSKVNLIW